ncbi:hypothetical protein G6F64_015363 [Rhizopus arrhizus]|uniref:Uncharacterized protein n=1 Tax=Rhizopus oryzae TaxID=64495 RepID=A0A9P7BIX1_RHIOR|nr:hypothetical protein G6F64_015363 [Rhizopus arrhizus]
MPALAKAWRGATLRTRWCICCKPGSTLPPWPPIFVIGRCPMPACRSLRFQRNPRHDRRDIRSRACQRQPRSLPAHRRKPDRRAEGH